MIGGASLKELGFVALLIGMVLLAPLAPRIGEAIGGLFARQRSERRDGGTGGRA